MISRIFVNLHVKDVAATRAFFSDIGFAFNPNYSNEVALCMELGPNMFAMLVSQALFTTFTDKPIADTNVGTEVITCLQVAHREKLHEIVDKAVAAGGQEYKTHPDHGFMFTRCFQDLDGHKWEVFWMEAPSEA